MEKGKRKPLKGRNRDGKEKQEKKEPPFWAVKREKRREKESGK